MGIIGLIRASYGIINGILIPLAFALCFFYFFWGVAKYIRSGATSDKAAEEGRRVMIWGVVGLFVALSVWGIINLIQKEVGILPIEKVDKL